MTDDQLEVSIARLKRRDKDGSITPEICDRIRELAALWTYPGDPPTGQQEIYDLLAIAESENVLSGVEKAAAEVTQARASLDEAMWRLKHQIRIGALSGASESELARLAGVTRTTVRKTLGKPPG